MTRVGSRRCQRGFGVPFELGVVQLCSWRLKVVVYALHGCMWGHTVRAEEDSENTMSAAQNSVTLRIDFEELKGL